MITKADIENFDKKAFLAKLRKTIGKVSFSRDALAMYYCLLDPKTPLWVKATIVSALIYFVTPYDAIPDIVVLTGFLDDAAIIAAAMRSIRAHVSKSHWEQANRFFDR